MGLPVGEVQTAIITVLRGDSTLQGLLGNPTNPPAGIYDSGGALTNTAFPYVAVQPITGKVGTLLVMGTDATDIYLQVSVFTKYGGFSQARSIMKQVYSLLNQKSLTLTGGFNNPLTLLDNYQEIENGEAGVEQITVRFKLYTQG